MTELTIAWSKASLAGEVCAIVSLRFAFSEAVYLLLALRLWRVPISPRPSRCDSTKPQGKYRAPKIFAYRKPWEAVVSCAVAALGIPAEFAAHVVYVDSAAEAVAGIVADAEALSAAEAAAAAVAAAAPESGASSGAAAMPAVTAAGQSVAGLDL